MSRLSNLPALALRMIGVNVEDELEVEAELLTEHEVLEELEANVKEFDETEEGRTAGGITKPYKELSLCFQALLVAYSYPTFPSPS